MESNNQIKYISINNIDLDEENIRLPKSFRENNTYEKDIINWMLENASIIKLMLSIGQNGFFIGDMLFVIKKDKRYIAVDGNRRLAALKLLENPSLGKIHTTKIRKVLEETTYREQEIPCIIFNSREEFIKHLGYRHMTGIMPWRMITKAKYLNDLIPYLKSKIFSKQARELAKTVGTRSDYVKRSLIGYKLYEIADLNENTFYFNYIVDALKYETVTQFLNIDLDSENPLKNLDKNNLNIITQLFITKGSADLINLDNFLDTNKMYNLSMT